MEVGMKRVPYGVLVFVLILGLVAVDVLADERNDAAVKAAESWLGLVDAGDAAGSWNEAAELLKKAVTEKQWEQALKATRTPLGKLVSRKLTSADYSTSLPGAPDGEYVVIQFATSFENKKSAVETVTPMKDPDGTWRVSGYFVR
jgi:hypothetical protein